MCWRDEPSTVAVVAAEHSCQDDSCTTAMAYQVDKEVIIGQGHILLCAEGCTVASWFTFS